MRYIDELRTGKEHDRRIKITELDKTEIKRLKKEGSGIRELARKYGVDKRLIQFIIYPERQQKNLEDREKRGGSKQYYNKDKWKETMREHRAYKKELLKKGLLKT